MRSSVVYGIMKKINLKNLFFTGVFAMLFIAAYRFVAITLMITQTAIALRGLGVLAGFIILFFGVEYFKKTTKHK